MLCGRVVGRCDFVDQVACGCGASSEPLPRDYFNFGLTVENADLRKFDPSTLPLECNVNGLEAALLMAIRRCAGGRARWPQSRCRGSSGNGMWCTLVDSGVGGCALCVYNMSCLRACVCFHAAVGQGLQCAWCVRVFFYSLGGSEFVRERQCECGRKNPMASRFCKHCYHYLSPKHSMSTTKEVKTRR